MSRGGADEFSGLGGKQRRDRFGVFLFCRLAGNDERAGINVVGSQIGVAIGIMDEIPHPVGIDRSFIYVRS